MPLFLPGPGPLLLEKLPEADTSTSLPPTWPTTTRSTLRLPCMAQRGHRTLVPDSTALVPAYRRSIPRLSPCPRSRAGMLPVQPQIPVPNPVLRYRIESLRSDGAFVRRGRQWGVVPSSAVAVVSSWVSSRAVPKRLLGTVGKGKRTLHITEHSTPPRPFRRSNLRLAARILRGRGGVVPVDQSAPPTTVRKAPRRPQAPAQRGSASRWVLGQDVPLRAARAARSRLTSTPRGRQATPTPVQAVLASPIWVPARIAGRKLLAVTGRGRRVTPTPPQVPVPAPAVPRTAGRWRWAAVRKGRQTNPVLTQATTTPPSYPPSKVGAARRLLSGAQRGRRTYHIPGQPVAIPKVGAPRRLLNGAQRGRRWLPTPAQVTIPKLSPPNRWPRARRVAVLIRGRRYLLPWPIAVLIPNVLLPTSITIDAHTTMMVVNAQQGNLGVDAHTSGITADPHTSGIAPNAQTANLGVDAHSTGVTVDDHRSTITLND